MMFKTRINKGYCKGTQVGLKGCVVILATSSTTLVGTTCTIVSSIFLL
jgi:hypothetical protein